MKFSTRGAARVHISVLVPDDELIGFDLPVRYANDTERVYLRSVTFDVDTATGNVGPGNALVSAQGSRDKRPLKSAHRAEVAIELLPDEVQYAVAEEYLKLRDSMVAALDI